MNLGNLLTSHRHAREARPTRPLPRIRGASLVQHAIGELVPETLLAVRRDGSVEYANSRVKETFGHGPKEIVEKEMQQLIAEGARAGSARLFRNFVQAGSPSRCCFESRGLHCNGKEFPIEIMLTTLIDDHEIVILALIRDLTERESLKEQLSRCQTLELLGMISRGVTHDFNNALTVVNGFTETLLGKPAFDEETRSILQQILHAGQHAADLARRILNFNERKATKPRILDLNDVVEGTVTLFRSLLKKSIDVTHQLAAESARVMADSCQLERVIINLVINARDAIQEKGEIHIKTANFVQDATTAEMGLPPGEYVMLAVSDNGCGMDEKTKARIFQPLFTTKPPGKGSGLGLSTVAEIVKENHGHIRVISEPGRGTTFKLFLPRVEEAACVA